jgi:peroxiredoxin Q/BCP
MVPQVGQKAPDFALPASTGKTISLKDLAGKRVVLYFYPKDDTRGCTIEACGFRDNYGPLQQTGAVLLGVSPDDLASHEQFIAKHNLPFPLLYDKDAQVANKYSSWGERVNQTTGQKTIGIIRNTFLIDERGYIERVWEKVVPEEHIPQVMQALMARK